MEAFGRAIACALFVVACSSPPPAPARSHAPVIDLPCAGVEPPPSERTVVPPTPDPTPEPVETGEYPPAGPEATCPRSDTVFSGTIAVGSGATYDGTIPSRVLVRGDATLRLSYPLRVDVAVPLHGPLRGEALIARIRAAYHDVYEEEDRDPGAHPYGIWGHELGDLFIESIERCETEQGVEIRVGVGS